MVPLDPAGMGLLINEPFNDHWYNIGDPLLLYYLLGAPSARALIFSQALKLNAEVPPLVAKNRSGEA